MNFLFHGEKKSMNTEKIIKISGTKESYDELVASK